MTDVVFLPTSLLFMLGVHEMGHATLASLSGAQDVRLGLYRRTPNGGTEIGWADWREDSVSPFGNALAHIGGVLFTRGWVEASDCLVRNVRMPEFTERFLSLTFVLSHFDFPRYVLQDGLVNLFGSSGSDIDGFVTQIAGRKAVWRSVTYAALLAVAAVDLVSDWDRIVRHWGVLGGRPYERLSGHTQPRFMFDPFLTTNGVGLHTVVSW